MNELSHRSLARVLLAEHHVPHRPTCVTLLQWRTHKIDKWLPIIFGLMQTSRTRNGVIGTDLRTGNMAALIAAYDSTTSMYTARWPMRHAVLPDNYWLAPKLSISANGMYLTICVEWASDHLDLRLTWIYQLLTKIYNTRKRFLTFLFPVTSTFNLKFAPLVTLAQRYVSTRLSSFEKIRGTGRAEIRTDRQSETDGRGAVLYAAS